MSNSNLDLTLRAYEASLRGPYEDFVALLDEHVSIVLPASLPHGGAYRGKAGARELRERLMLAWAEFAVETLEFLTGQDSVIAIIRLKAVARATGKSVDMRIAEFWRFAEGKVVELSAYYFDTKVVFDACTLK